MKGRWYFNVMRYNNSIVLLPSLMISWNSDLWAMVTLRSWRSLRFWRVTLHWLLFSVSVERWSF